MAVAKHEQLHWYKTYNTVQTGVLETQGSKGFSISYKRINVILCFWSCVSPLYTYTQSFYNIIQSHNIEREWPVFTNTWLSLEISNSFINSLKKTIVAGRKNAGVCQCEYLQDVHVCKCALSVAERTQCISLEVAFELSLAVTLVSLTFSSSALFWSRASPSTWKPTISW